MERSFINYTVSGDGIISGDMTVEKTVTDNKVIRSRLLEIPKNYRENGEDGNEVVQKSEQGSDEEILSNSLLSTCSSVLESFMELHRVQGLNNYLVFSSELFDNLHFGVSNLVEKCTMSVLLSNMLRAGRAQRTGNWFAKIRTSGTPRVNLLLSAKECSE